MNRNGLFLFVIAAFIAIVTIWFNYNWINYKDLRLIKKDKKIDYYLSDFTLLNINPDGTMRYRVEGKNLIHQQSTGATQIFTPLLQARSKSGDITTLVAQQASQEASNGPIMLIADVIIEKNSNNKNQTIKLQSSDVTYNPTTKVIRSDKKVALISDNAYLQGVGFISQLDDQEIRILSNVQAKFEPAK